jgi:hypothetical protein
MSNELAMLNTNLPDYLRTAQIDDTTKALMGSGSGASSRRISIKGGVWRLMINGKEVATNEDRHMNVVVVAAAPKVSRTFYANQYQEGGEIAAPTCWSSDGEVPDPKAASPQSKRCIDCPQNVQGSGQGNSRACRYSKRIAVVLANDIGGDVFQLTLPSTSIFGEGASGKWPLQAYAKMLGSKGIPITAVVTEMRFDTNSATPKINFKAVSFLDAGQHQLAINQGSTEAAKRAITMTVAEADNVKAKPAITADPAPKAAAPIEVAAEPDEAVAEPVKRVSKKNEETAEKPDISKILAEWDD